MLYYRRPTPQKYRARTQGKAPPHPFHSRPIVLFFSDEAGGEPHVGGGVQGRRRKLWGRRCPRPAAGAPGAAAHEAGSEPHAGGDVRGLAASSGPAVSPTWVAAHEAGTEPHVGSHELRGDGELQSAVGDRRAVRPRWCWNGIF